MRYIEMNSSSVVELEDKPILSTDSLRVVFGIEIGNDNTINELTPLTKTAEHYKPNIVFFNVDNPFKPISWPKDKRTLISWMLFKTNNYTNTEEWKIIKEQKFLNNRDTDRKGFLQLGFSEVQALKLLKINIRRKFWEENTQLLISEMIDLTDDELEEYISNHRTTENLKYASFIVKYLGDKK